MLYLRCVALMCGVAIFSGVGAKAQRPAAPGQSDDGQAPARERYRPPDKVTCPRNDLTSYQGRVIALDRRRGRTIIRLRTDWETTERVVLTHPDSADASAWFLLKGQPFEPKDWSLIVTEKNQLRPGVRANAWVCRDGSNPIVDWQPQE